MSSLYLLIDLAVIAVPLAFSWHRKLRFIERWRDFLPACLVVLAGFITWDAWFTARGIWGFNETYVLGWRIAGLPVEEWLFFLCVPYACVFTYHALDVLDLGRVSLRNAQILSILAILGCLILVALFPDRMYTLTTSVLVLLFLTGLSLAKPGWIGRFWFSFLIILLPFTLTNGVLTGLRFWEYPLLNLSPETVSDQVVWYNNVHNLGIRFFSIPLDDFLYALLLTGLNVTLFEFFGARRSAADASAGAPGEPSPDHA